MASTDVFYMGLKGSVTALIKESGEILWETHLKGSGFVNLMIEPDCIIAHTHGELFCVDLADGKILWRNGLKGFGYGMPTFVSERGSAAGNAVLMAHQVAQQQQQAAAT